MATSSLKPCLNCDGFGIAGSRGYVADEEWVEEEVPCPVCHGSGRITVMVRSRYERIRDHLARIAPGNEDNDVASFSVTGPGLARAIGVTVPNVRGALSIMVKRGEIEVLLRHVKGAPRRLKTYRLLYPGRGRGSVPGFISSYGGSPP